MKKSVFEIRTQIRATQKAECNTKSSYQALGPGPGPWALGFGPRARALSRGPGARGPGRVPGA